jgi:hypothetical protein
LAVGEGVIDDGGEEVDGLDEGLGFVETINPRIVSRVGADEDVGVMNLR